MEAAAQQEDEAAQSDYGDDFASLNPSEKSEPKRPASAVVKRKPKRPTVDKAPSPQALAKARATPASTFVTRSSRDSYTNHRKVVEEDQHRDKRRIAALMRKVATL